MYRLRQQNQRYHISYSTQSFSFSKPGPFITQNAALVTSLEAVYQITVSFLCFTTVFSWQVAVVLPKTCKNSLMCQTGGFNLENVKTFCLVCVFKH